MGFNWRCHQLQERLRLLSHKIFTSIFKFLENHLSKRGGTELTLYKCDRSSKQVENTNDLQLHTKGWIYTSIEDLEVIFFWIMHVQKHLVLKPELLVIYYSSDSDFILRK